MSQIQETLQYKSMIFCLAGIFICLSSYGQKVLVIENENNFRNIKYFEGDKIMLKLKATNENISDYIFDMTDTSLILENRGEIRVSAIKAVVRENWFLRILSSFSLVAGVGYLGIDSFNRLINSEWPMVDSQTLMISTGIVVFGAVLLPFRYRYIHLGEKWKYKVLDPEYIR